MGGHRPSAGRCPVLGWAPRSPISRCGHEHDSARLFNCGLCHALTAICCCCDRGHGYCSEACSAAARGEAQRASNARYERSRKGARKHAARQARYRAKKSKVTEQGPPPVEVDVIRVVAAEREEPVAKENDDADLDFDLGGERAMHEPRDQSAGHGVWPRPAQSPSEHLAGPPSRPDDAVRRAGRRCPSATTTEASPARTSSALRFSACSPTSTRARSTSWWSTRSTA